MSKTPSIKQETFKQEITSRRKYLIGPIVFLHLFTFSMFNTIINLYYPYHAGKELFPNKSLTSEESSLCQSSANSSSTNEQIVQSLVAEYFLYASVCMGIPCLISNIFIGSISDRYGRKKLLLVPTFGLLIAQIVVVVFMYVNVSLYYFLIPSIFLSIMGDIFAVFQIALSYVSDITEGTKRRTVGIALVELFVGMGTLLGGVIAGYLIQSIGYIWTLIIATIVKCANLVNILLLPSTIPPTKTPWSIRETVGSLKESFQFYYSRQIAGTRWKYNLSLAIFIIVNMATIGRDGVETLYIISPPFCFTPVLVGWFHATNSVMQQAIAMILIRLFLKFFSNEFLAMFGALSGITYFVIETAARSTLMLFLAPVFGFGLFLGPVTVRAIMSLETPSNKQGALYGGLAAIQTFFTYFGAMVFNAIYKNTVKTNKRIYLMVIIALLIVALILSMVMYMKSRIRSKKYAIKSEEIYIKSTENTKGY